MLVSFCLLAVYAVAPFCLFAYLLFARDLDSPANLRQYGFLYESYRREVYWWELVAMARRFLLAFSASVLSQEHTLYYSVPVAVICACSIVQIQVMPYHSKRENLLELCGSAVILLTFQTGQYMAAAVADLDVSQIVAEALVLLCNGAFVVYMLVVVAREIRNEYHDKARRYYGRFVVGVSRLLASARTSSAFAIFQEQAASPDDEGTIDPL